MRDLQVSGRPDLNRRPPAPKAGALPGCATPRGSGYGRVARPGRTRRPAPASPPPWPTSSPLRALHYDLAARGGARSRRRPALRRHRRGAARRAARAHRRTTSSRSTCRRTDGGDPYAHAARDARRAGSDEGVARARRRARAVGARAGLHRARTAGARTRHGFFARVRVEDYGAGRIRPHERTHPGPKEDRLRLTRATSANLSPIFALYDDGTRWSALEPQLAGDAVGRGDRRRRHPHRLWRVGDPGAIAAVHGRARRRRAADRRRPPPLRDRARLRRGDRRRGRAPLRADVPGRRCRTRA